MSERVVLTAFDVAMLLFEYRARSLLPSAKIAKVRLSIIVRADREAVPCGRWRKVRDARDKLYMMGAAIAAGHKAIVTGDWRWFDSLNRTLRPHYRWTVRR